MSAYNKQLHSTIYALSTCVQLAALPLSHTTGQRVNCD